MGLDDTIAGLAGGSFALALAVAVLLGLRHATDPDHLTAVTTLVATEGTAGSRRAALLGLAWGLGHATTLFILGLPLVLLGTGLPSGVERGAEALIGLVIAALALRLLLRWRRGYFHIHAHTHGDVTHSHPHVHAHEQVRGQGHPAEHRHAHPESLGRSPRGAYGIGLLHGVGGSGAFGALLLGAVSGWIEGVLALLGFALATAVSMTLVSSLFGNALTRGPALRRLARAVPALGIFGLVFGAWYALGAV